MKRYKLFWTFHGWYCHLRDAPFDWRYGVDTSGVISAEQLGVDPGGGWGYMGTPAGEIRRGIRSLPINPNECAFVDIGSGKGKAVLVASRCGFRAVSGVEHSESLHRIAERNAQIWRAEHSDAAPIQLACSSALDFSLPPAPVVIYLYNPFDAIQMQRFLDRLEETYSRSPGSVLILYRNPTCQAEMDAKPYLQRRPISGLPKRMAVFEFRATPASKPKTTP